MAEIITVEWRQRRGEEDKRRIVAKKCTGCQRERGGEAAWSAFRPGVRLASGAAG